MCSDDTGREKANIADISDEKLLDLIDLVRKTFDKLFQVNCPISLLVFLIHINLKNGIKTEQLEHELMKEELKNQEYGA